MSINSVSYFVVPSIGIKHIIPLRTFHSILFLFDISNFGFLDVLRMGGVLENYYVSLPEGLSKIRLNYSGLSAWRRDTDFEKQRILRIIVSALVYQRYLNSLIREGYI